jgi:hypothetical protein
VLADMNLWFQKRRKRCLKKKGLEASLKEGSQWKRVKRRRKSQIKKKKLL